MRAAPPSSPTPSAGGSALSDHSMNDGSPSVTHSAPLSIDSIPVEGFPFPGHAPRHHCDGAARARLSLIPESSPVWLGLSISAPLSAYQPLHQSPSAASLTSRCEPHSHFGRYWSPAHVSARIAAQLHPPQSRSNNEGRTINQ